MDELKNTVKKFLEAWKVGNYQLMFELTQKTWKSNHRKRELKNLLHQRLKKYAITGMTLKESTPLMCDVSLTLRLGGFNRKVVVRIIRETMPYKPSEDGEWGINPISLIKNLY